MTSGTNAGTTTTPGAPASARVPLGSRAWVKVAGGFVVPLLVLGAWQYVTTTGIVPPYRLPPPASVIAAAAGTMILYPHRRDKNDDNGLEPSAT